MITNSSLWTYIFDASGIVKVVMLLLLIASIISWALIVQRGIFLRKARQFAKQFEDKYTNMIDLDSLHIDKRTAENEYDGLAKIFRAGFQVFAELRRKTDIPTQKIVDAAVRAMRMAQSRECDKLEQNLSVLATIGSTSPYVGLFGTVWGIMTSFHALGGAQQATISMVAPGISEALIATAMGLFAAIPAVIFYNRYSYEIDRLTNKYQAFQEDFSELLSRQTEQ